MKKIFICSPFRAETEEKRNENIQLAVGGCVEALREGHAPFAPHLFYPVLMDDDDMAQRETGISAGIEYLKTCDEVWVYAPGGVVTAGMQREIEVAASLGVSVKFKEV